jgi:PAS domain S-box-containing protein
MAIVAVDRYGTISLVNREAERLFGYARDEIIGRPIEDLVPERFRGAHGGLRSRFVEAPEARRMGAGRELYGLRKDGTEVPVEIGLNPVETEDGLLVLGAIVDISERKRLEERFRAMVESAPMAMVMIEPSGTIRLVNAETERAFGYARQELVGQSIDVLVPERLRAGHGLHRAEFFASPASRAMGVGRDLFGRRRDGSEFPVEIGLNPLHTSEGTFVMAAVVDINGRKRLEQHLHEHMAALEAQAEELRSINDSLEREIRERRRVEEEIAAKNQELETLLHVIAHDLKEPLRGIESFAGLVVERHAEGLDERGRDFLERVVRAARRMSQLLSDLSELSRARRIEVNKQEVSSLELVEDVLRRLAPRVEETGACVRIAPGLPSLRADRTWATQAVYNLVANALKFTRPGEAPEVDIAPYVPIAGEPAGVGLVVADRGPGVKPEAAERIFQLFQRLVGREVEGTGAGLAIVRQVATRHRGHAWVRAREDGGAEFVITFGSGAPEAGGEPR